MCELILSNWIYTGDQVNLTYSPNSDRLVLSAFTPDGQWDVLHPIVYRYDAYYETDGDLPYPEVHVMIRLNRYVKLIKSIITDLVNGVITSTC